LKTADKIEQQLLKLTMLKDTAGVLNREITLYHTLQITNMLGVALLDEIMYLIMELWTT
jgi:hypothetical protein